MIYCGKASLKPRTKSKVLSHLYWKSREEELRDTRHWLPPCASSAHPPRVRTMRPLCPLHQSARDGFRASCSVFSAYCPLMCTVFVCTHLSASLLVNALIFLDFTSFQILKQVLAIPPALSCSHGHEEASSTAEGFFPQWRGPHTLLSIRVGFLVPSTIG